MRKILYSALACITLSACQTTKEADNMVSLDVAFSWENTQACSTTPPAFDITNVPEGTKFLRFHMTDLNVPSFMHGGGTVPYSGNTKIPAGSFGYTGPCPPSGSHRYRFTVEALNESKDLILGKGEKTKAFPPSK
jgi:phosphatidylethanolamine-binding protein (PEBP) family uncharacterized protein